MDERSQDDIEHVLFDTARTYPVGEPNLAPDGFVYDRGQGQWISTDGQAQRWAQSPTRRPPGTKKHDVETGEDQKGH